MSDPKRYCLYLDGRNVEMKWDEKGNYVRWDDYARLKAEVERLTERNQFLEQVDSYLQSANLYAEEQRSMELEAQVERLTKAGDGLEDAIIDGGLNRMNEARDNWNAAKEGKQS